MVQGARFFRIGFYGVDDTTRIIRIPNIVLVI